MKRQYLRILTATAVLMFCGGGVFAENDNGGKTSTPAAKQLQQSQPPQQTQAPQAAIAQGQPQQQAPRLPQQQAQAMNTAAQTQELMKNLRDMDAKVTDLQKDISQRLGECEKQLKAVTDSFNNKDPEPADQMTLSWDMKVTIVSALVLLVFIIVLWAMVQKWGKTLNGQLTELQNDKVINGTDGPLFSTLTVAGAQEAFDQTIRERQEEAVKGLQASLTELKNELKAVKTSTAQPPKVDTAALAQEVAKNLRDTAVMATALQGISQRFGEYEKQLKAAVDSFNTAVQQQAAKLETARTGLDKRLTALSGSVAGTETAVGKQNAEAAEAARQQLSAMQDAAKQSAALQEALTNLQPLLADATEIRAALEAQAGSTAACLEHADKLAAAAQTADAAMAKLTGTADTLGVSSEALRGFSETLPSAVKASQELTTTRDELQRMRKELTTAQEAVRVRDGRVAVLEQERTVAVKAQEAAVAEKKTLNQNLDDCRGKLAKEQEQNANLLQNNELLRGEVGKHLARVSEMETQRAAQAQALQAQQQECTKLRGSVNNLQATVSQQETALREKDAALAASRQKLAAEQAAGAEARAELQALVPPKLETAEYQPLYAALREQARGGCVDAELCLRQLSLCSTLLRINEELSSEQREQLLRALWQFSRSFLLAQRSCGVNEKDVLVGLDRWLSFFMGDNETRFALQYPTPGENVTTAWMSAANGISMVSAVDSWAVFAGGNSPTPTYKAFVR